MATAPLETFLWHIRKLAAGRASPRSDAELVEEFSARSDQTAFAALLALHGPMVLRVCRRVLNHEQDAEDAFQATFLVLARNAASIRKREALAEWLHGVAYRTAMEAKRKAARRRNHEARRGALLPKAMPSPTWDDIKVVLDEEIQRLPQTLRAAFVLCVLEGKSRPEAAAELGVKLGTLSSRLTQARKRLQQRLIRRGIQLSALLSALAVVDTYGKAAVPAALATSTLRSGLLVAAGGPAAGVIPSQVAALAAGVTRAMLLTKVKVATVILMTVSLLAGTAGVLTHQVLAGNPLASQATRTPSDRPSRQHTAKDPVASLQAAPGEEPVQNVVTFRGRVLDPDGKRVAGAKLFLTLSWGYLKRPGESPAYCTTGADGGFQFTAPKANFHKKTVVVVATAQGFGPGWVEMSAQDKNENVSIQLVKDDVPITGQVVDLQGRPVPGATLSVLHVRAAPKEGLAPWIEAVQAGQGPSSNVERDYLPRKLMSQEVPTLPHQVATDTDGRFRLAGLGRDRLVTARIDVPTIASQELRILTRQGKSIKVSEPGRIYPNRTEYVTTVYYGAAFQHVAGPTQPVLGVIRDKDSVEPIAGLMVESFALAGIPRGNNRLIRTTTDAQGRYRLVGMPKGEGNEIIVVPDPRQPYLPVRTGVPNPLALGPIIVDFEFKRGIWIEGRISDKDTGKPVRAMVEYFARRANPHLRDHRGFTFLFRLEDNTREDGTFHVVGLPGPGILGVRCGAPYLLALCPRTN
jgi:RNA polymerase sigma factor (sigma-70 family)